MTLQVYSEIGKALAGMQLRLASFAACSGIVGCCKIALLIAATVDQAVLTKRAVISDTDAAEIKNLIWLLSTKHMILVQQQHQINNKTFIQQLFQSMLCTLKTLVQK